jgi:hypothetical protein
LLLLRGLRGRDQFTATGLRVFVDKDRRVESALDWRLAERSMIDFD